MAPGSWNTRLWKTAITRLITLALQKEIRWLIPTMCKWYHFQLAASVLGNSKISRVWIVNKTTLRSSQGLIKEAWRRETLNKALLILELALFTSHSTSRRQEACSITFGDLWVHCVCQVGMSCVSICGDGRKLECEMKILFIRIYSVRKRIQGAFHKPRNTLYATFWPLPLHVTPWRHLTDPLPCYHSVILHNVT